MQPQSIRNRNEKLFEAIDALLASDLDPVSYAERLAQANTLVEQGDTKGLLTLFNALRNPPVNPADEATPEETMLVDSQNGAFARGQSTHETPHVQSRVELGDPFRPVPLRFSTGDATREIAPVVQAILHTRPPKRTRVRFGEEQKRVLQHHFFQEKDYWPSRFMRRKLAKLFDVDAAKIYTWFASARSQNPQLKSQMEVEQTRVKLETDREKTLLLMYRNWVNRPRFPV